jgi:hypothetical protein
VAVYPTIQPHIDEQLGELFETIFSIPVGKGNIIQYEMGGDAVTGPNAIAVLPDNSLIIADLASDRLLHYTMTGKLLDTIELHDLGINNAADLRTKGDDLLLLENGSGPDPQRYWVRHLSLDGKLIASDEIPSGYHIEDELAGIAVDCDGSVLLELEGGSKLFRLADIQIRPSNIYSDPGEYLCNNKIYRVDKSTSIIAGDVIYSTRLTSQYGGFRLLNVFQDGSLYVIREDVVNNQAIQVDQTLHYISGLGTVQGMARIPLSEFYYSVMRSMAIGPNGEVFVLLPKPDSIDVIRLNFHPELGPLIPGAAIPQITICSNSP